MSTGSWDESSNLVKDLPSPPPSAGADSDDIFGKNGDRPGASGHFFEQLGSASDSKNSSPGDSRSHSPSDSSKHSRSASPGDAKHSSPSHKHGLFSGKKSKAAKGLSFLIKASKEGAKRRSKSPGKSPSKSLSKSPSREELEDDLAQLEPVDEQTKAKSEQWQAFLQMQDRIKLNVLKTQQNIGKLAAGRISPSGRISPAKHREHDSSFDTQWTNFGADDASPPHETEGSFLDQNIDLLQCEDTQLNNGDEQDDGELSTLITGLRDLPHLKVTPAGSSHHSVRRSSMERENQLDLLAFEKPVPPSTPVDPTAGEVDLLGLGFEPDTSGSGSAPAPIINEDLLGLDDFLSHPGPIAPSGSVSDMTSDWFMGYSSTTQSSAQSSLCSSPVAFDPDFLAEQGQFASDSTAVSDLARSLVDDFLQWGAQTEKKSSETFLSKNPFQTDTSQTLAAVKPDAFNPFATIVESDDPDIPDTGFSVQGGESQADDAIQDSGFNPLDDFFSGPVSSNAVPAESSNLDPFGCAVSGPSTLDLNANPQQDSQGSFSEGPIMEPAAKPNAPKPKSQNPFLVDASEGDTSVSKDQTDFEEDFFASRLLKDSKANTSNVWGTAEASTPTQAFNPFENDLFTTESVPTIKTDDGNTGAASSSVKPINPFLTASFENINITPSADFQRIFMAPSTDELDTLGAGPDSAAQHSEQGEAAEGEMFDPFTSVPSKPFKPSLEVNDLLGTKELSTSTYDNLDEDHHDDDDDDMTGFSFKIKAEPIRTDASGTSPVPFLPPPPKPPKSPQMPTRENPFDRDSPPEENFANFQTVEEETKAKEAVVVERAPRKSMSSESSSTMSEDESMEPLPPFHPTFTKSCWKLMLRQPTKKKLAGNRYWKTVHIKLMTHKDGPVLRMFENENCDGEPFQELPLQPCYSISQLSVQQFDQYGKIHTCKVQYIFYRERVGIKPERITPSFVKKPKATMVLDHAPQVSELLKFGSLEKEEIRSFVWEMEDAFMKLEAFRDKTLSYTKDEIQAEVWDEYEAIIDKDGHTTYQKARVRIFVLAFITGMPTCEIGINDRTRKGKEVVGRHDIIPVKTEDWIRIENAEFHCVVDLETYEKTNNICFRPLDACQFELLRFRVRPRENRELPMQLRIQQIMKDRHFEIRCDMLVTGYHAFSKKCGQFPCEDIEIRFKIPEPWIYYFRYERKFKYGSFKSMTRKPGKIKGLERITMMAQGLLSSALMEASVGTAKYEHLYRSVVWRIPRLPERNQGAYKNHLFVLRLDLGQHDEIPESFEEWANVEFNTPATTVSKAQVRSISVENPTPPEKWVRYMAKYQYRVQMDCKVETDSDHEGGSD